MEMELILRVDVDAAREKKSVFGQLLWMLQALEVHPLRTGEDAKKMINSLCGVLRGVLDTPRISFSESETRRLLRGSEIFFNLIQSTCVTNSVRPAVFNSAETLLEGLLNYLSCEQDAETQLIKYSFIGTVIPSINNHTVRKALLEKLMLRIISCSSKLWSMSVSNSPIHIEKILLNDRDINLFFYFCQLLEATITFFKWDLQNQQWLGGTLFETLSILEQDCEVLFVQLPQLTWVLYPSIFAVSQYANGNSIMES